MGNVGPHIIASFQNDFGMFLPKQALPKTPIRIAKQRGNYSHNHQFNRLPRALFKAVKPVKL